ncbi:c-type cytochrome [Microcoleus sp.]|uniref:c-type cytochrome n=1 Tax=Microcoleus sp. TaxID=44472 RepID=UPI0035937095
MNREIKIIVNSLLVFMFTLLLVTCASRPQSVAPSPTPQAVNTSRPQSVVSSPTAQATRTFNSNGERIYLTSTSDRGTNITYTNGQSSGSMGGGSQGGMMGGGSQGGMMGAGKLACASCHGFNGRGGTSTMMGIQTMNAPDIRWSALKNEFDAEKFRLAVTKGQDPDGKKQLNNYMPRWKIGNEDLADLIAYLKTLP